MRYDETDGPKRQCLSGVPKTDKQVVHVRVGERLASTFPTELEKKMIGRHGFVVRIGNVVEHEIDEFFGNENGALRRRSFERDAIGDLTVVTDLDRSPWDIDILQPKIEDLVVSSDDLLPLSELRSSELTLIIYGCIGV
jgi:hypothetical protein